ncbi:hypothetical protein F0562_009105 [Nyssa sinensis]|uniref:O-fucosyltransferase family protein n=1 Tax=Nyssa sinensis TaxID=561372 RepID=A0A5J4ZV77_9ASTE|nr:hypothetical protein F0562_009105 [Nyssa sinensis]
MDVRQVIAAFLTLSVFAMLGNMIKRDHFDSFELPATSSFQYDAIKLTKENLVKVATESNGPWEESSKALRPCWNKSSLKEREQSKGFITFSLTDGPEYHVSQIADAVVIARYLGAALVLPDIRVSKPVEQRQNWFSALKNATGTLTYLKTFRNLEEIYDVEKFIKSLDGGIRVAKDQPAEVSNGRLSIVRVPNRVSEDYIAAKIEPLFRRKGNLRLETYFPSLTMTKAEKTGYLDSYSCLAMFRTLQLQPGVQEVVDSMIGRLRTLSLKSNGRFIAVDLRAEMLGKDCRESEAAGRKSCYKAREIGEFLKKIGFHSDTTIYLTQSVWHSSLDGLREIYPRTYTKEVIMPADKKAKFLNSESAEIEKVIDFHICSESDVFVPAFTGLFYANVAGKRIASGKTQIIVPSQRVTSSCATDYISPYISKKSHLAYSCFC